MRGKTMDKVHAAHHHKRARGGDVKEPGGPVKEAGGNPYVEEEAAEKEVSGHHDKKHGGKVKRARGGRIEGHAARHHLGKPGRKRGGRAGADLSPLSSASRPASIGKQAPVQASPKSPD
jgi:hypothetical protein